MINMLFKNMEEILKSITANSSPTHKIQSTNIVR